MKRTITLSERVYRGLVERDRQLNFRSVSRTAELLIEGALADIHTGVLVDPATSATRRLPARGSYTEAEIVPPDVPEPVRQKAALPQDVSTEDFSDLMAFGD